MIKKDIKFTDFDDVEHVETHYFHLTKSELIELEMAGGASGLGKHLEQAVASENKPVIYGAFRDIILAAYGRRDPDDPAKFTKSDGLKADFRQSLAFDALVTELAVNDEAAGEFMRGVVPKDLAKQMSLTITPQQAGIPAVVSAGSEMPSREEIDTLTGLQRPRDSTNELLAWALREPTNKELDAMTKQQLLDVSRRQMSGWKPQPL